MKQMAGPKMMDVLVDMFDNLNADYNHWVINYVAITSRDRIIKNKSLKYHI